MQSGDLDHLFDVYEQTEEKNAGGQKKQIWKKIGQFYGGVQPISANSFVQSSVQGSALICRVVMRPDDFPEISAIHIIQDVDTKETYKISGALPVKKGKKTLMCTVGKLSNGI